MARSPKTLLSPRFVEALQYAIVAHAAQVRKGTDISYVAHLLGVASLVVEHGGDEDQAIAGLLHDTIEDCGQEHEATIRMRFGDSVAEIVKALTDGTEEEKAAARTPEEKRANWQQRKDVYLAALSEHHDRALLVSCCDKLHNARAIVSDLHRDGKSMLARFTAGPEGTLWYYAELAKCFEARGIRPAAELSRTVREMERLANSMPA